MSKTFKTAHADNKVLKVDSLFGNPRLLIKEFDGDTRGFAFAPSDAPALALAILEAAGYDASQDRVSNIGHAMHWLNLEIELTERATAKAKEQAELEAEALKLLLAFQAIDDPDNRGCEWHQYGTNTKDKWLAVARKARELGGRAEK